MEIVKLSDTYYCKAGAGFIYEEFEKKILDGSHLRKDSFADVYSKKIFKAFFQYAEDLKKEYEAYYCQEYKSFDVYLYNKELLERNDIERLNLIGGQTLLRLNINLNSYNAHNLIDYEESGIVDILNQALKERGL